MHQANFMLSSLSKPKLRNNIQLIYTAKVLEGGGVDRSTPVSGPRSLPGLRGSFFLGGGRTVVRTRYSNPQLGLGYPPPHPRLEYSLHSPLPPSPPALERTGYAVGGMPLAVSHRRTFLLDQGFSQWIDFMVFVNGMFCFFNKRLKLEIFASIKFIRFILQIWRSTMNTFQNICF